MEPDYEQLAQEAAIWPWLDSDCMSDPVNSSPIFFDPDYLDDSDDDC